MDEKLTIGQVSFGPAIDEVKSFDFRQHWPKNPKARIAQLEAERDAWQQTCAVMASERDAALGRANGWKAEAMTQNASLHGAIEAARAEGYRAGVEAAQNDLRVAAKTCERFGEKKFAELIISVADDLTALLDSEATP